MRFTKTLSLVAAVAATLSLAACGVSTEEKKDEQRADRAAVDASADAALPTVIIAKVPVDADGNQLGDQVETVALAADADLSDAEAAFATGTAVSVADELDQDSSSDQWNGRHGGGHHGGYHHRNYYWNTPWYPGRLLGRGIWWGRNPYAYYGGYSYGYNYGYSYYRPGCNYYVYNRGW
jgi:Flp pilus assembly protein TadG